MTENRKPRLVGINHVALEVGDIDEALSFYGRLFEFELRGETRDDDGTRSMAFIDMGDQFLALSRGREGGPDAHRHFGLVVDDRSQIEKLARAAGADMVEGPFLDIRDPWGNRIEIVEYRDLQFLKSDAVLEHLGVSPEKSDQAKTDLSEKGITV